MIVEEVKESSGDKSSSENTPILSMDRSILEEEKDNGDSHAFKFK